jgi:putative polyhydroxyalkanoate system protein
MADIHIERAHALGLERARQVARRWMAHAEEKYEMKCTLHEGVADGCDEIEFTRSGVKGRMRVEGQQVTLDVKLGLLLTPFARTIEAEATKQLDEALDKEARKTQA